MPDRVGVAKNVRIVTRAAASRASPSTSPSPKRERSFIASLPKGADADAFMLEAAVELLATQRAKGKPRRAPKKAPARKAAPAAIGNGAAKPGRRSAAKPKPRAKAATKKPTRNRPA